jgi:tetratricopeptide (TPR) repeat protein
MPRCLNYSLAIVVALIAATSLPAQQDLPADPPRPFAAKKPPTQEDLDRRESLYRFVEGLVCAREDRLLEALKAYQEAARLDPSSAAVFKAQVPVLIALERGADAAVACRKAVERDPDDYETWALLARLSKAMGRYADAREALEKGLRAEGLDDRPELAQQMNFDLGSLYEADQNYGPAADAYRRAAELLDHPDVIAEHAGVGKDVVLQRAAETYERIGDLYRKAKKYEQAAAAYLKAQERAPKRAERLNFNLAQVWQDLGDDGKAQAFLDAYLRTQPLGMDAYEMKIALLRRTKKEPAIVPWLEDVAKLDRYNVALHLLLARECGRARQPARAEEIYRGLAETSASAELYRGLFRLYQDDPNTGPARSLGVLEQAMARGARKEVPDPLGVAQAKAMVTALRDDGELARGVVGAAVKALNQGAALRFETLHLLAVLADKHRQLAESEKLYRACLAQLPVEAEPLVYGGLLRVLSKSRRFDALVAVCDGALDGNAAQGLPKAQATNQILFLTEKARALAGLQRFDDAVQAADRALLLAADGQKMVVRHLRVRLLVMAGRHDDAEKECAALLKQAVQPAEVLEVRYLLSNVYSGAKQLAKSEEQLQLILKEDPDNAAANNDLGYLWADQNRRLDEAEQMIRKAIDVDRRQRQGIAPPAAPGEPAPPPPITPVGATGPVDVEDNAAYVDSLGWVLYRKGKIAEARQELERAAHLPDGEDPVIWDHLGDVYQQLQMPAEARSAWEHSLRLYEQGQRRMDEERCQELRRKLKKVGE